MAFFEKLNDFAKNISDKTNEAIETGKLQSKVTSEKNLAGEELKKIGEFYYNLWLESGEAAAEILEFCANAKAHYDSAAEAQGEIDRIRAENEAAKVASAAAAAEAAVPAGCVCPGCGTVNEAGIKFCRDCGTKLEPPVAKGIFCTSCGTENKPGTRFCSNCGTRLEIPEPPAPKTCPKCGELIAEGMRFCGECGTKIE